MYLDDTPQYVPVRRALAMAHATLSSPSKSRARIRPSQSCILRISDARTLKLVELYKKEQCLWNTSLEEYKMRTFRELAAQRIADELKLKYFKSRHVIIKIKNLRNSYNQELKKIEKSRQAGDDPIYHPKVFWFDKMDSFLRPHLLFSRKQQLELHHEVIVKQDPDEIHEILSNQGEDVETFEDYEPKMKRSRNSSYDSSMKSDNEMSGSTWQPTLQNISTQLQNLVSSNNDDCFDSFGKYVATMLRNMPKSKAMKIQPKIVTLLVAESLNDEGLVSQSHDQEFL